MPTKQLPNSPSLDHLKHQARDLLAAHAAQTPDALQRIREFHPHHAKSDDARIAASRFTLSDAQLAIAREYGFQSWAKLKAQVEKGKPPGYEVPHHERIEDPIFRKAVDLLDAGDAKGLTQHLLQYPDLVRQHVTFEGGNYFDNPSLLQFIAENPIRHGKLPPNIVDIAKIILDAGARDDVEDLSYTLSLACSGMVVREMNVQGPLINLLCKYGAAPDGALLPALAHGEFEAAKALIESGATVTLYVAAALGQEDSARKLLPQASESDRNLALPLAAMFGHTEIVKLLLKAGIDPNRYNPVGLHSHSTPLHQAAYAGHLEVVRVFVEHGAKLDIKDIHHNGTPLDWAAYCNQPEVADYLRSVP
ncbi:MAG: ankyrin repeat domain-containing protein [Fimbriimonadaceae bacterium]|nr:ankyrin repeat domain-containing protein [Fimbriimonadaceae bacterium]